MEMQDWIAFYERKTGERFERKTGTTLLHSKQNGFCEVALDDEHKAVYVYHVCGRLKVWRDVANAIAQLCGYDKVMTIVIRHIKPWLRLGGAKVTDEEDTPDGNKIYRGQTGDGYRFTAYPSKDNSAYIVVWEVQ